jgi:CHASE3 domain sensor protein
MTFIRPNNNKSSISFLLIGLITILLLMVFWGVNVYNQTVNLRHNLSASEQKLQELKVANADIKNKLYQAIDSQLLTALGEERGLMKVKSPDYIQVDGSWSVVSVSQL